MLGMFGWTNHYTAPAVYCTVCMQDVAWTLSVTKTGTDTTYQSMVTGQVMLSNNQQQPLAVYRITAGILAGQVAQVICGTPPPFRVGCYLHAGHIR